MTDIRRERNSTALEHSKRKSVAKDFSFRRMRSARVSAEIRCCLEGVYTVRR